MAKRPCAFCKQETKGNPNRCWYNGICFCSFGCIEDYKKIQEKQRLLREQEKYQKPLWTWMDGEYDD